MKDVPTVRIVSHRIQRHSKFLENGCIEITLHVIYRLRDESKIEFSIAIEIVQDTFNNNDSENIMRNVLEVNSLYVSFIP